MTSAGPAASASLPPAYGTDHVHLEAGRIQLFSTQAKGWSPVRQKTATTPEIPGTGIFWDDSLYEVVAAEPTASGVLYTLVLWPEGRLLRSAEVYDRESDRRRIAAESAARAYRRRSGLLYVFSPGVGLLPARVQLEWEQEYGINAARMTLFSLFPLLLFGTFCLVWTLVLFVGSGEVDPPLPRPLISAGLYFWCESLFRLRVVLGESKPMGSAPVVALVNLVLKLRRMTMERR